jgi:hypothetical protein
MAGLAFNHGRRFALVVTLQLLAAVVVAPAVGAASQAPGIVHGYTITESTFSTYLTGNNPLFPAGADDAVVKISPPFPVVLYGVSHSSMWVSTNGNVQFGRTGQTNFSNTCLPSSTLSARGAIAPFWDDLIFGPQGSGDGVYTKTYNTSPNRQFVISWRGAEFGTHFPVRAEVIFYENSPTLTFQYNQGDSYSTTIGLQKSASGAFTQWSCDSSTAVSAGERLDFIPF